ncbi:hypothetical protein PR202_gb01894 [Eleusine coracana subsp. coracana]|uniref:F-box protein At5g52880-like ARM repeats region domain-containing protein n=1 Tax=Eleusine coracana subsp. coracana TaxID=191504 RepID=A0AAV5DWA7_ELECO|nr:hypothetical protein PR202_gb01894 [Eleusine coracana subsp. coracana]
MELSSIRATARDAVSSRADRSGTLAVVRRGRRVTAGLRLPRDGMPVTEGDGSGERYREMGIAAALARPWDYPTACGELVALLRLGYTELPKAAQAQVAADVLLAFRLLPE